jgi:hypothetical protein
LQDLTSINIFTIKNSKNGFQTDRNSVFGAGILQSFQTLVKGGNVESNLLDKVIYALVLYRTPQCLYFGLKMDN